MLLVRVKYRPYNNDDDKEIIIFKLTPTLLLPYYYDLQINCNNCELIYLTAIPRGIQRVPLSGNNVIDLPQSR